MTRITLRLPTDLSDRLREEGQRMGVSLNQMIVATLRDALARSGAVEGADDALMDQVFHVRRALRDLVTVMDPSQFAPELRRRREGAPEEPAISSMPKLQLPLSATIIEDRRYQG